MRRYRIGRADTNDIVLADPTVSREHAELVELGGGRFEIKDLGSTFGVSVWQGQDWAKVTQTELRHDAQLRIGEVQTTVADLLRDTDKTVVRARASEAPPAPAERTAPPPAESTVASRTAPAPDADKTAPPSPPRPAPPRPAAPQPAPPKPAAPRPAPPRPAAPSGPVQPPFQFLRNLPPEKRTLLWLGIGFAGFLLIALITLILALVL
jgi:uncharacterized membrane protein